MLSLVPWPRVLPRVSGAPMRRDYIATDPDVMAEVRFVIVAIWLFGGNDSRSHSGFHAVVVAIEYSARNPNGSSHCILQIHTLHDTDLLHSMAAESPASSKALTEWLLSLASVCPGTGYFFIVRMIIDGRRVPYCTRTAKAIENPCLQNKCLGVVLRSMIAVFSRLSRRAFFSNHLGYTCPLAIAF